MFLFSFIAISGFAQNEKPLVRDGNKDYKKGDYVKAEEKYRAAIQKNNQTDAGKFNLGDALYQQKKYDEAAATFQNLSNEKISDDMKAKSLYNQGNSYLKADKYQESADAYKQSLRLNPKDEDTRYNYAYALAKLRQQQQQQKQNKDDKNKQDKDKKDDKKQDQQKKDDQKQNKDQQQQQKQEAQQPKISKEDAERMLQALKNDEKDLQKRLAKKEGTRVKIEKQW